jgi:hypothetical protein
LASPTIAIVMRCNLGGGVRRRNPQVSLRAAVNGLCPDGCGPLTPAKVKGQAECAGCGALVWLANPYVGARHA